MGWPGVIRDSRQAGRVIAALKCSSLWGVRARRVMDWAGLEQWWSLQGVDHQLPEISTAQKSIYSRWGFTPQHFILLSVKFPSEQKFDLNFFGQLVGLLVLQSTKISVSVMKRF